MAQVLVVDDDVDACRMLARLFEKSGHDSVYAAGGREALSLLGAIRFNLVLLDLRMPEVGGMDVLRAIRKHPVAKDTPVVIFSAEGSTCAQDEASRAGADDYVHKPVRWADLYNRVGRFLDC
jgi:DNA-binding response OmpR family regulator